MQKIMNTGKIPVRTRPDDPGEAARAGKDPRQATRPRECPARGKGERNPLAVINGRDGDRGPRA
ncbi:MAG: hypothetical protein LBD64_06230 [Odoribacteraceae bacterium]|nr:hypothetical protein [Odoribacteraceae bacterium]